MALKTDYKFWYIRRTDDVHIDKAAIRFYEGDITTENEKDIDGNIVAVTRYRQSKRLKSVDLTHLNKGIMGKETEGKDVVIYTPKDFGIISSDDELRVFLNGELMKDPIRIPVDGQNTLDITKVK